MKRLLRIQLASFFAILLFNTGAFADVKAEMRKAAFDISKAYKDKTPDLLMSKNLAILNLTSANEKLQKAGIGQTIAALLANSFSQSTIFKLVDREGLSKILKEQSLASTGAIAEEKAVKMGNLVGAELLLTGDISELGENIVVNLKVTDVETGALVIAKSFNLSRDEVIKEANTFIASTFQSASGINFGLFATYGYSFDKPNYFVGIVGPQVSYKFTPNFAVGLGFQEIFGTPPSDAITKVAANTYYKFAPADIMTEFHSPTFFATGVDLFFDFIIPIGTQVNMSFRVGGSIYPSPQMTYEVTELPSGELHYDAAKASTETPLKADVAYRSISVIGSGYKPLYAIDGQLNFDFLISKRLSVLLGVGYEFSPSWTPTIFTAKGNVQSSTQTHDGKKTDDASLANYNGTFEEFFEVNFAQDRKGHVYGFGGSLLTATVAVALHF